MVDMPQPSCPLFLAQMLERVVCGAGLAFRKGRESDAKTAGLENATLGHGGVLIEAVYDSFGVKPPSQVGELSGHSPVHTPN